MRKNFITEKFVNALDQKIVEAVSSVLLSQSGLLQRNHELREHAREGLSFPAWLEVIASVDVADGD